MKVLGTDPAEQPKTSFVFGQTESSTQAVATNTSTNEMQVISADQPEIPTLYTRQITLVVGRPRPSKQAVPDVNPRKKQIVDSNQPEVPTPNTHQTAPVDGRKTRSGKKAPKAKQNLESKQLARKVKKCTLEEAPEPSSADSEQASRRKKLVPVRQKDQRTRPPPIEDPIEPDPRIFLAFHANYQLPNPGIPKSKFLGSPIMHRFNARIFRSCHTLAQRQNFLMMHLEPFDRMFNTLVCRRAVSAGLKEPTSLGDLDELCAELEQHRLKDEDKSNWTPPVSQSFFARFELRLDFQGFYSTKLTYPRSEFFEKVGESVPSCFKDVEGIVQRLKAAKMERMKALKRSAEVEDENEKDGS